MCLQFHIYGARLTYLASPIPTLLQDPIISSQLCEALKFLVGGISMFQLLTHPKTRRRMARERRGAGSSLVSMETPYYKQYIKDVL